jgi:hypothetical protein
MNLNKFGIMTRAGVEQAELSKRITVTEATNTEKEERKGWLDAETAKSQAVGMVQRFQFQNC